jgi:uroporphyrinogen decarboxylase
MTSKERLICAINHKEPDRVPLDLGGCQVTGIQATLYRKLKEVLGFTSGDIYVYEPMKQLALVEEDVRTALGIDTVSIIPDDFGKWHSGVLTDGSSGMFPEWHQPESMPDGSKILREEKGYFGRNSSRDVTSSMLENGHFFSRVLHPLKEAESESDIDNFEYFWEQDSHITAKWKQRLDKEAAKDSGVVVDTLWGGYGFLFEVLQSLRGMEEMLIDMIINEDLAHKMIDNRFNAMLKRWNIILNNLDENADVVCIADDLGSQNSLLISPDLYRTVLKPYHKKLISHIKSRTNAKVFMHSCGAIYNLIPDLIEVGVDILNPVQTTADGMDPVKLKSEFGKDIVFWGSVDTQDILEYGTVDQVKDEVKMKIDTFAPGGGFVFNNCHNIQGSMPLKNLEAMFDAFSNYA